MKKRNFHYFVFVPLIFSFIAFALVNKKLNWIDNKNLENRNLRKIPTLNLTNLDPFPKQFDTFVTDNFGLRAYCMRIYGNLCYRIFKKSPIPETVYFGEQGWMFFTHNELATFNGSAKFSESELDSFYRILKRRTNFYDSVHAKHLFVVVPVKQSVYPEMQGESMLKLKKKNRTDILLEYLNKKGDVNILDCRPALVNNKSAGKLFYKTDNHWNSLGAYFAAKSIAEKLRKMGLKVKLLRKFKNIDTSSYFSGNLCTYTGLQEIAKEYDSKIVYEFNSKRVGLYDAQTPQFANSWEYQIVIENEDKTLDTILVIRDSFGSAMVDFLGDCFGKSVFIFDQWLYGINRDWVNRVKPNAVVHIIVENNLGIWLGNK